MNLIEFTEFLVKELAKEPDLISVKQLEDPEYLVIQVLVSSEDISRVIGKDGANINAIRTIVQSASYLNNEKKVKINVDAF